MLLARAEHKQRLGPQNDGYRSLSTFDDRQTAIDLGLKMHSSSLLRSSLAAGGFAKLPSLSTPSEAARRLSG